MQTTLEGGNHRARMSHFKVLFCFAVLVFTARAYKLEDVLEELKEKKDTRNENEELIDYEELKDKELSDPLLIGNVFRAFRKICHLACRWEWKFWKTGYRWVCHRIRICNGKR